MTFSLTITLTYYLFSTLHEFLIKNYTNASPMFNYPFVFQPLGYLSIGC